MSNKICTICNEPKLLSGFYKNKKGKDGLHSSCKECFNKKSSEYKRTKEGIVTRIYTHQRSNSDERNHCSPSYNLKELREWMFNQPNFNDLYNNWVDSGYDKMLAPSCDRKDDYKPYTFDNIQLLTWQENLHKSHSDRINGINNKLSKTVVQMDKLGNFVNKFYSSRQASRRTGIHQSNISECCNRKTKSAGGFCWMFEIN